MLSEQMFETLATISERPRNQEYQGEVQLDRNACRATYEHNLSLSSFSKAISLYIGYLALTLPSIIPSHATHQYTSSHFSIMMSQAPSRNEMAIKSTGKKQTKQS
jgi:hypothetical protein